MPHSWRSSSTGPPARISGPVRGLAMPQRLNYTWLSYSGAATADLAIILVAVAAVVVYAGGRVHRPILLAEPSVQLTVIISAGRGLAIVACLVCATEYVAGLRRHNLLHILPKDPSPIA